MHVVTGILAFDVRQNGTFQSHYPTGTVQADFTGSTGNVLVVDQAALTQDDSEISLSFDSTVITVTNLSARTLPAGHRVFLQLDPYEQADRVLGRSVNEPTGVPVALQVGTGLLLDGKTLTVGASRVVTTGNAASAAINGDATDIYELSAIANDTTFTITGTPVDGQQILIRYKDAGVAKALTWTGFTPIGVTLPTITTADKWGYVGVTYNATAVAWHALAVATEA